MAHLVLRDRNQLEALGFGNVAHVPFLLSRNMDYLDECNRFLRERALGVWHPNRREATAYGRVRKLGRNSALAYGNDLKNFVSYLEVKRLEWRELSYQQLLDTYDSEMNAGRWRSKGKAPLAPATINRRMRTAVEFLLWAGDRNHRAPFQVLRSASSTKSRTRGRSWTSSQSLVESRVGIHRVHPKRLRLPTNEEILRWLAEVRTKHGRARYLACKHILQTGCRLEETALIREVQLPDPATIDLDMPARMDICYGTKGYRDPSDPDQVGKKRTLRFNRTFLVELHNYRQLGRKAALKRFADANPNARKPARLFLDDVTGKPLSKQAIYRAWHNCKNLPFPGFSPHLGRHAFACFELLRLVNDEVRLIGKTLADMPRTQMLPRLENLISIYLMPVMGHIDEQTTELYLEWLADHLWLPEHRMAWTNYLEEAA
jgi:site-specific recombinase XerD